MGRVVRVCAWLFYGFGWGAFVALIALFAGSILCEALVPSSWDLDDGLWLLLPLGAAAGLYLAFRLRESLVAHLACLTIGSVGAVAFFQSAYGYFTTAAAMRPGWDGLPDRLSGLILVYCGITVASLAMSGLAGLVLRSQFARNTPRSTEPNSSDALD